MLRVNSLLEGVRTLDPTVADLAPALVLTTWATAHPGPVQFAMTAAIALRQRHALLVLVTEVAGLGLATRSLELPEILAILVAAYSAALYSPQRRVAPVPVLVAG